jgi:mono/diheme cytochrome c family protein
MLFESSHAHHLRKDFVLGGLFCQIRRVRYSALLICAALLVGSATVDATSQESRADSQEDVEQDHPSTSLSQRSAATREFLGLGALPDKVAAARGMPLFAQNCAACHGQAARGGIGPSLITSDLVLTDEHGEQLVPFLKKGKAEKGMPAFSMSDQQLRDITEFLHLQVESVANRGTYHVLNILVGNAPKGKAYVQAHCMSCHRPETFLHIASKYRSPEQLQRNWIWPVRDRKITANVKTSDGTISGQVTQISDFRVTLLDKSGETHTIDRGPDIEVQMNDPLAAHQRLVMTLANDDMHNVTAYLETLK